MGGRKVGKFDTRLPADNVGSWPRWARRLVSAALIFHLSALLAAALAQQPASPLEQAFAGCFEPYYDLIDQGYSYRYYAPEPPPTPVVTATLHFADGRADTTVRLPERRTWPRLRYQRQLALAYHMSVDFEEAKRQGEGAQSLWARSFARHLAWRRPGLASVSLATQFHLIPDLQRVRESLEAPGGAGVDLDAEEFYSVPERIGDFPCDAL